MPSNPQNGSPVTASSLWASPAAMETPQTRRRRNINRAHSAQSELIQRVFKRRPARALVMSLVKNSENIISSTNILLSDNHELSHILSHHCACLPQLRDKRRGEVALNCSLSSVTDTKWELEASPATCYRCFHTVCLLRRALQIHSRTHTRDTHSAHTLQTQLAPAQRRHRTIKVLHVRCW